MITKKFIEDIINVAKKHGVTIISSNPEKLIKSTRELEGYTMFFTKGEKVLALRGGENFYLSLQLQ